MLRYILCGVILCLAVADEAKCGYKEEDDAGQEIDDEDLGDYDDYEDEEGFDDGDEDYNLEDDYDFDDDSAYDDLDDLEQRIEL